MQTGAPFEPLRPPSPSSLGKPRAAREYRHSRKWGRRALILLGTAGTLYVADRQLCASGVARSLRTFGLGLLVAVDYKLNFRPEPLTGGTIEDLHLRSAERLFALLRANGGLYLKIGQAIAMLSAVLPPEYQRMFAGVFDDAPQASWADIEKVIRGDFGGRGAEEVFGVSFEGQGEGKGKGLLERRARASASVAQVHWARLPDGREVAIKIQKPEIARQVGWDLWAFKVVMRIYTYWFDLPLYSVVPYVTERLSLETDFAAEARNSETMRALVDAEPALRGRVYVPRVYPEFTSRRVLVTEWVEGVRLWDKEAITGRWLGGRGTGSPGAGSGAPLAFTPADLAAARRELRENPLRERLKPDREAWWRGRSGKGGLGLTGKEVMSTIVDLFSAQMFKFGVVHCDPHPGNLFVRRLPSGRAEVVLIDHGLYVYMSPRFRHQYSRFWKALMAFDNATIAEVTSEWGIRAPDFFASVTLMRPYEGGAGGDGPDGRRRRGGVAAGLLEEGRTAAEASFAAQRRMQEGLRDMLADESRWPMELIFIGRSLRVVQANNQFLGSPVNRVKRMGVWASRSLYQDPGLRWRDRLAFAWRHLLFRAVLLASDVAFWVARVRQWLGYGRGMDDELEGRVRDIAREMGFELQGNIFDG